MTQTGAGDIRVARRPHRSEIGRFFSPARLHVRKPWLGELELREQSPAGDPEQVGHRDLVAERDQRGMDAVLEDRAVLDQVQPPPRALALGAQLRRGWPDRRHQIPERQLRQDPGVDLG